ncbi:MFS transporter [Thermococcus sp. M39]|uniref:MFS transporter n=1 Tax=unclassified Thermococcus TaxID=2627626 RepID=UPI00143A8A15|nr:MULTISPECIES: MFS transporter [unclassified Thermococcus]NJE07840.1 MFS transporter [Thermococcus sp. M39]NJE13449.1 MFS transporter [Thermococcus sp. LS2]
MRKKLLLLLSLGWIFNYAHRMAIPPLIPIIKAELGINNAQAGLLMTSLLLPYALIQVPAGYLGDKLGRKKLVVVSILGYSLASAFIIFAKDYWELLSIRALYGIFAGLYYAPATALISDIYKERKGTALGVFMVGPPIGSGIAPLIVVPIALTLEWRYAFLVLSIMSAIIGIALLISINGEVHKVKHARLRIPKHVIGLSIMNFIVLAAFFGMLTFLPDFFVNKGRSLGEASLYFSVLSIVGIIGSLSGGAVYDKLKEKSLILSLVFNAFLSFLLAKTALPLIIPILGLFFYSVGPIVTAYTAEQATEENKGSVMGFVNMMGFFGATLGPYLLGASIDRLSYERAFYLIPLMYLIALSIIGIEKGKVIRT